MESPSTNSRSTRSPFVPVKRHQQREQQQEQDKSIDDDYNSNADMKASTTPRPPVVPLTTSNLCRYTATLSNQQQQQHREVHNEEDSHVNKKTINTRPPSSPALTSSSSVQAAARSLGHGLPSAASTPRRLEVPLSSTKTATTNNIASSMLSAKRYTRQMAAPPADETIATSTNNNNINNNGMLSASDLRARARVTSGSATRWKGLVPSEKPPQSIYARPETPSSSMSRARARSVTANTTGGGSSTSSASVSRPISICSTPRNVSRPPSRAGGDYPSHASVSRPQSRMDDFPPESIIRTKQSIEDFKASDNRSHARRGSDTSVGTVVQRKQENVLVCVRVRPPAIPTADRPINPAHLEEAWIASNDERAIGLADGTGHRYRFGTQLRCISIFVTMLTQLFLRFAYRRPGHRFWEPECV
jgi:hypothetical protein